MSQSLVDRTALEELGSVIGRDKLDRLVDRFAESLATAFEGGAQSALDRAREAHTLISMSGMLGCQPLSDACREIERAAKAGADLADALADVRTLRDRTVAALRQVRAEAGGSP